MKVDANGAEQWQKTFSMGEGNDIGGGVVETGDGYVVAGLAASNEGRRILLIKTDLDGAGMWRKTFVGGE